MGGFICTLVSIAALAVDDTQSAKTLSENKPTGLTARSIPASKPAARTTPREVELSQAVAREQKRHFDVNRQFVKPTQTSLQDMVRITGAKPQEAAFVWKLMLSYPDETPAKPVSTSYTSDVPPAPSGSTK